MKGGCNIDIKDGVTLLNEYGEYMDVDKVNNMCTDCTSKGTCIALINCLKEGLRTEALSLKQSVYEEKDKVQEQKERAQ